MTLQDVLNCITFPSPIKESLSGIVRCSYKIALSKGKTETEAAEIAMAELVALLDRNATNLLTK